MNFKYNLSKSDYKKIIYEKNSKTNFIYMVVMSIMFLIITVDFLIDNTLLILIFYIIYTIIMLIILFVLNKILTNLIVKLNEKNLKIKYGTYECKLKDNTLNQQIDDFNFNISLNDIRKIKYNKNMVIIYPKSKLVSLIFKKELFLDEKQFDKFVKILKEKVIISK